MKALISERYGPPDLLRVGEVETPVPAQGQVLVRVRAASLNSADWRTLVADPFLVRLMGGGLLRPAHRIPGADVAGTVEAVGPGVTRLQPGDDVLGDIFKTGGAFAEYACADEGLLARKPASLSFEEAAALPLAGVTAWHALHAPVTAAPGMEVLIHGSSGGVGHYALQIARALGAHVTAVCSTAHVEPSRDLGADRVIDYRKEDFSGEGPSYDLILGINGNVPLSAYGRALRPGGTYVMVGGGNRQLFEAMLLGRLRTLFTGKTFTHSASWADRAALEDLVALAAAGKVKPCIDRIFTLDQGVEAYRCFGQGHTRGKLVITTG